MPERTLMVKTNSRDNFESKRFSIILTNVVSAHFWDPVRGYRIKGNFLIQNFGTSGTEHLRGWSLEYDSFPFTLTHSFANIPDSFCVGFESVLRHTKAMCYMWLGRKIVNMVKIFGFYKIEHENCVCNISIMKINRTPIINLVTNFWKLTQNF